MEQTKEKTIFTTTLDDYHSKYGDNFSAEFISAVAEADAMKAIGNAKLKIIQLSLKKSSQMEFNDGEIIHIYRLIKLAMEQPKEKVNPYALLMDKQQAIAELNKDIRECKDLRTKSQMIQQLGELNGWQEDRESEALIESNEKLFDWLNKHFTASEQEYIAFSMLDEAVEIESGDDNELEDSSILEKVEIE